MRALFSYNRSYLRYVVPSMGQLCGRYPKYILSGCWDITALVREDDVAEADDAEAHSQGLDSLHHSRHRRHSNYWTNTRSGSNVWSS